jgi:hypothetical protein
VQSEASHPDSFGTLRRLGLRALSLRSRLVLLTLVLLVPALLSAGVILYAGYRQGRQEIERHLQETARALSLVVDRQLGQTEALLWALSTSPQLLAKDYADFDVRARVAIRTGGSPSARFGSATSSPVWWPGNRASGSIRW